VLKNCRVLQCDDGAYFIVNRDVYINDGCICDRIDNAEVVDLKGRLVLPTYFNAHSHLGESIFKDITGIDWTLNKYLDYTEKYNGMLAREKRDESWYKSACYSAEEMLISGTTGFCAARSAGIANQFQMNTMAGYPLMLSNKLKSYVTAGTVGFTKYYKEFKSKRISVGIFLHSLYKSDENTLKLAGNCFSLGAEFITVHVAEDAESKCMEVKKFGKSPIEILDEFGLLHEKTILVHGGYLSIKELELISASGSTIAICPISNVFLNTKMVDIELLESLKIPWCIATDGLATGRTFSLVEQVKLAHSFYPQISLERYYRAITSQPAKCYGRKHYTGNIELGTEAKFLTTDYEGNDIEELFSMLFDGSIKCEYINLGEV